MRIKVNKKFCRLLHPLSGTNLGINKNSGQKYCKACNRIYMRKYIKEHTEYRKQKTKNRKKTPKLSFKYTQKWRDKKENKEKQLIYIKVREAVRKGKITKEKCFFCGKIQTEGHHSDYSKPLEVLWVCRQHHKDLHRMLLKS